jgi:Holliday junction resolvasome RuvABC ATP-dependent DNA helicase subunit
VEEIATLIGFASIKQFGLQLARDVAFRLAGVSQGTPRVARNLLRCVMEVAQSVRMPLSLELVDKTLRYEELDPMIGLNRQQRRYLMVLATEGSMGAKGLATMLDEEIETIEYAVEPFLMQEVTLPAEDGAVSGILVRRTTRGREITPLGMQYLALCQGLQNNGWFLGETFM